jgi:hypothetical protein
LRDAREQDYCIRSGGFRRRNGGACQWAVGHQAQSKELREQNQAPTKRIAYLERRQRKLEAQPVRQPAAAQPANPADSMAAEFAYRAEFKKAPVDDSLTWYGITLYGLVDMGVESQTVSRDSWMRWRNLRMPAVLRFTVRSDVAPDVNKLGQEAREYI